jgi:hypothetical protein
MTKYELNDAAFRVCEGVNSILEAGGYHDVRHPDAAWNAWPSDPTEDDAGSAVLDVEGEMYLNFPVEDYYDEDNGFDAIGLAASLLAAVNGYYERRSQ